MCTLTACLQGPLAALQTARLLTGAARCEIDRQADACTALEEYGLSSSQRVWLAVLATRRETLISPITNCIGYHLNTREENGTTVADRSPPAFRLLLISPPYFTVGVDPAFSLTCYCAIITSISIKAYNDAMGWKSSLFNQLHIFFLLM